MNRIFVTFADSRHISSRRRIREQAKQLGVYDKIIICDEYDLCPSFRDQFKEYLVFGSRGFGYWSWKPQIILQILEQVQSGDIIHYADMGCHLNLDGRERLFEYFTLTQESRNGILAFAYEEPKAPLKWDGRKLYDWPNEQWTKGDLIEYFGVRNDREILESQIIGATTFLVEKRDQSCLFMKSWINVIKQDFHLIDDSPSVSLNQSGFIEHRHDQSIFSILCRLNLTTTVSAYEHYYPSASDMTPDWTALRKFPVHARRDMAEYSFVSKGLRKWKTIFNKN